LMPTLFSSPAFMPDWFHWLRGHYAIDSFWDISRCHISHIFRELILMCCFDYFRLSFIEIADYFRH
jgi:hypothetical protein